MTLVSMVVFMALALLAAPLTADAQVSGRVPRVGLLGNRPSSLHESFEQGLKELGYEDGRNVIIERRWTQGDSSRYSTLAAELVRLNVDVIVANYEGSVNAVRQVTSTVPIVFYVVDDPVAIGYAASLRRPGGMITGLSSQWYELIGKRLQILKEAIRQVEPVAVLTNPPGAPGSSPGLAAGMKHLEVAAQALRLSYRTYLATMPGDLDNAVATMARDGARSLVLVSSTPLFYLEGKRIADLALKYRLPTMTDEPDLTEAGCLMSYTPNLIDLARRSAAYVDKILRGAKPGDLPIEQPTKFDLVINLKTAKALGLTLPPSILARADRIIE